MKLDIEVSKEFFFSHFLLIYKNVSNKIFFLLFVGVEHDFKKSKRTRVVTIILY